MNMTITNNDNDKIPLGAGIIVFDTEDPGILRSIENCTHAVNSIVGNTLTHNFVLLHDITKNNLIPVSFNNHHHHLPKIIYNALGIESYRVIFFESVYHLYYAHRSHNVPPAGAPKYRWEYPIDGEKMDILKQVIAAKGVPPNG